VFTFYFRYQWVLLWLSVTVTNSLIFSLFWLWFLGGMIPNNNRMRFYFFTLLLLTSTLRRSWSSLRFSGDFSCYEKHRLQYREVIRGTGDAFLFLLSMSIMVNVVRPVCVVQLLPIISFFLLSSSQVTSFRHPGNHSIILTILLSVVESFRAVKIRTN